MAEKCAMHLCVTGCLMQTCHFKPANISQRSISWPLNWKTKAVLLGCCLPAGSRIPDTEVLEMPRQNKKPPKERVSWALCERFWRWVEFVGAFAIDTRPLLPASGCGLQGWVVRLWWKSDVCVGVCELALCQGRGSFVLLIREVGPTD